MSGPPMSGTTTDTYYLNRLNKLIRLQDSHLNSENCTRLSQNTLCEGCVCIVECYAKLYESQNKAKLAKPNELQNKAKGKGNGNDTTKGEVESKGKDKDNGNLAPVFKSGSSNFIQRGLEGMAERLANHNKDNGKDTTEGEVESKGEFAKEAGKRKNAKRVTFALS